MKNKKHLTIAEVTSGIYVVEYSEGKLYEEGQYLNNERVYHALNDSNLNITIRSREGEVLHRNFKLEEVTV